MNSNVIPLPKLPLGSFGKVKELCATNAVRRRMLDLGLIQDTTVEALLQSPSGDPSAYQIRGAVIALRSEEARHILVQPCNGDGR